MAGFLKAARTEDVPAGQGKMVGVGGKHIALFNVEGTYYAIDHFVEMSGRVQQKL